MSADREVSAATGAVPEQAPMGAPAAAPAVATLAMQAAEAPAQGTLAFVTPAPASIATTPAESIHAPVEAHAAHNTGCCANCDAILAGHFCANCGQRVENPVHSLWHFIAEATEDLTHADSRLWGTVGALLFKPGFLTTEFLAGRRVKYLPPVRLYLVMSVLFFLFAAIGNNHQPTAAEIAHNKAEIAKAEADFKRATGHKLVVIGADDLKAGEDQRQHNLAQCALMEPEMRHAGRFKAAFLGVMHKVCVAGAQDDGHALSEAFLHNLPKALFITLPVMAALMKLLYRRPRRHYVEHLLFLLHEYSFVFLWFAICILLGWIIPSEGIMDALLVGFVLYAMYYYFRAQRHVYSEGLGRTVAKVTVLSFAYLIVALVALVATAVYSVLIR